jgi:hypothetical protein
MLNKIAQIAHELDQLGLHDEADILTDVLQRVASVTCPCGLTMLSQDSIDANYCDACDRVLSDVRDRTATAESKEKAKKPLNKPFRTPGGPKKFSVYVKDGDKVKKVNFGDPNMEIKRDDPERRKNFRARHNCDDPGPKTKARYWSCKMWQKGKSVGEMTGK